MSRLIKSVLILLPSDFPFRFYFVYFKLGQQQAASTMNLDLVVARKKKILSCSCHFAINFRHKDGRYSVFWDRNQTARFLRGKDVTKYPLLGLGEIGNITATLPKLQSLLSAWPERARSNIIITYAQAYTPFGKLSEEGYRPFEDHPFLVSMLLGQNYIRNNPHFKKIAESTVKHVDINALKETIILQLSLTHARIEFVATSTSVNDVLCCSIGKLARLTRKQKLLIQVCCMYVCRQLHSALQIICRSLETAFQTTA